MTLLEQPELVSQDGYIAMAAGIWFYMQPQTPKPSIHDVMTGFFVPNSVDTQNNIGANFASTINIINGAVECGQGFGNENVVRRGQYYQAWLDYFELDPETEGLDCGD